MKVEFSSSSVPLMAQGSPKEMLTLSETEDGRRAVKINFSSVAIIQDGPRKAEYSLARNLRSNLESPATLYGSAIHSAMEVFYQGAREERVLPPAHFDVESMAYHDFLEGEESNLILRACRAFVTKAAPLVNLPDGDKRSLSTGLWTLMLYFETYIDDPYHVLVKDGESLVEKRLETILLDADDLQITYHGTVDAILEHERTGQVLVADHKTSSVVGKDFYNRLKPNLQYTGYLYLAQQVLGIETDKFMVNCLQVKQRPKTARGTAPHFPRQITTRSGEDIVEFKEAVEDSVRRYLGWLDTNKFPLCPVNACVLYGGCTYLDVCSAPNSIRENILEAKYSGPK